MAERTPQRLDTVVSGIRVIVFSIGGLSMHACMYIYDAIPSPGRAHKLGVPPEHQKVTSSQVFNKNTYNKGFSFACVFL